MANALYRKYRSRTLTELVGQEHITDILSRALRDGRISHAYLFTGPRGVGKTSVARILAHEINRLPYASEDTHVDIVEIDAASNNGVEDVRELRDKVYIAPAFASKKVYIIDEVHMLSKAAFNALLKTLEEPPEHVVFILATTDSNKLPATIISRTQRFSFRTVATEKVISHLKSIADKEGIAVDNDALELIARHGEGSFRDSISLLDQLGSLAGAKHTITRSLVEITLGLPPTDLVSNLLTAYSAGDVKYIITLLEDAERRGVQPLPLTNSIIDTARQQLDINPGLLTLIDRLLDVAKSHRPFIKLLTILASTRASLTPAASPQATSTTIKPKTTPAPQQKTVSKSSRIVTQPVTTVTAPPSPSQVIQAVIANVDTPAGIADDFAWSKVVEYARANYVAIFSVLSKCSHEFDDSILTIYTGNAFYKKKLDDTKYRDYLLKCLEAAGASGIAITTVGTPPPPKSSLAASVAAIMGGGEEVSVEL